MTTFTEGMWTRVMEHNKQFKNMSDKWRISSTRNSHCMVCQDAQEENQDGVSSVSILLRCSNEKCNREYHVDCAFNQGGLSLDEENGGMLSFLCDLHFKEVLFCTCKRKYDDSQAMVFCDECYDWFHTSCEGIKQREAQKLDQQERFVCHSCRAIAKEGRKISKQLQDRNMDKDYQSGCQQAAQKSVGKLIELAASIGPVIDDISSPSSFTQSEYTLQDVRPTLEYIQSALDLGESDNNVSENTDRRNYLDFMGLREYVELNANKVSEYLKRVDSWFLRAMDVCSSAVHGLSLQSLDRSNCNAAEALRGKVDALLSELRSTVRYEPQEVEAFYAFAEVIFWICDFHRALHSPVPLSPAQTSVAASANVHKQWFYNLSDCLRVVNPRIKKLQQQAKEAGSFAEPCSAILTNYVKFCSQTVANMNKWYLQTFKILDEDLLYYLSDLEVHLKSAEEFPVPPPLQHELKLAVDQVQDLESQVQCLLSRKEASEEEIEALINKKGEALAILPSDAKLKFVRTIEELLIAYQMALSGEGSDASYQGRMKKALAESLLGDTGALIETGSSRTKSADSLLSPLSENLLLKVRSVRDELKNMIHEAAITTQKVDIDAIVTSDGDSSMAGGDGIESARAILKNLVIVTPQEDLLDFHQKSLELQSRCQAILESEAMFDLGDADIVIRDMENTLNYNDIDGFPVAATIKSSIRRSLNLLVDRTSTADKLWTAVSHAIEGFKSGATSNSITYEDLTRMILSAKETKLVDKEAHLEASSLCDRACESLFQILQDLEKLEAVDEDNKLLAEDLLQRVSFIPLPKALLIDVKLRCEVCLTVYKCQKLLRRDGEHIEGNETVNAVLNLLRDLRHSLVALSQQCESIIAVGGRSQEGVGDIDVPGILKEVDTKRVALSVPSSALALMITVKDDILLKHWCAEVSHLLLHSTSLAAAEKLLDDAPHTINLNTERQDVRETQEWLELHAEIAEAKGNSDEISNLVDSFNQLKEQFFESKVGGAQLRLSETIAKWLQQSVGMEELFNTKIWKAKAAKILQTDAISKALDNLQQLNLINIACRCYLIADKLMSDEFLESPPPATLQAIDVKELTTIANKISAAVERDSSKSFGLLQDLAVEFSSLHHSALQWNEQAQQLQLHKVTTRMKGKSKSSAPVILADSKPLLARSDVQKILMQPIARAVRTPMHETLIGVLTAAGNFRQSLLAFLLPEGRSDGAEFDTVKLQSELLALYSLRDTMDVIPLELSETRVVNWLLEVFEWMKGLQIYPDNTPAQTALLPLAVAKKKLVEGDPIINDVETSVAEVLIDLRVYSSDPSVGFTGFHPSTHPYLKKSGDLYDFINDQVEKCENLQNKVQDLSSGYVSGSYSREQITTELSQLLIAPDPSIRRLLDKMKNKAPQIKGTTSAAAPTIDEDDGADIYVQGGVVEYWHDGESSPPKVSEKEKKKSSHSCAAKGCFKDIRPRNAAGKDPSLYCSDNCAYSSSGELLLAMVQYKDILCLFGSEEMSSYVTAEQSNPSLGTRHQTSSLFKDDSKLSASSPAALKKLASMCKGDVLSFASQKGFVADSHTAVAEFSDALQRQNMFSVSEGKADVLLADLSSTKNISLLVKREPAIINAASPRDHDSKKSKIVHQLISALPKAAFPVYCRGDTPAEGFEVPAVSISSNTAEHPDLAFRLRARYVMEDFFMKQLSTMNIAGALFLGSMLALEFEEDLYRKCTAGSTLNRVEYGKQQLKLIRNLKQSHNEQLIMKLVTCELSSEKLLGMSEKQLADFTTQQLREKQSSTAEQGSILRTSTQEVIEARQRNTMAGQQESWRGGSGAGAAVALEGDSIAYNMQEENNKRKRLEERTSSGAANSVAQGSRSLEIEQKVLSDGKQNPKGAVVGRAPGTATSNKRPIDVDAGSRFVGPPVSPSGAASPSAARPTKLAKLDIETSESQLSKMEEVSSPRNKTTNLLDMLRNKSSATSPSSQPHSREEGSSIRALQNSQMVELESSIGTKGFVITRPGGIFIDCKSFCEKSQMQRLLRPQFDVEGRTKIEELEKYIKDVIQQRKKIIATCILVIDAANSGPGSGYAKFCEEFAKDRRVGISNITKTGSVNFYTVPPVFKKDISILSSFPDEDANTTILYGVIIAKDLEISKMIVAVPAIAPMPQQPVVPSAPIPGLSESLSNAKTLPAPVQAAVPTKELPDSSKRPVKSALPPLKSIAIQNLLPKANAFANLSSSSIRSNLVSASTTPGIRTTPNIPQQTMSKVVNFCISKGTQDLPTVLQTLRETDNSRVLMPFIYEEDSGFPEFSKLLSESAIAANKRQH